MIESLVLAIASALVGFASTLFVVRLGSAVSLGLILAIAAAIILHKSSFSLGASIGLAIGAVYVYQIAFLLGTAMVARSPERDPVEWRR